MEGIEVWIHEGVGFGTGYGGAALGEGIGA